MAVLTKERLRQRFADAEMDGKYPGLFGNEETVPTKKKQPRHQKTTALTDVARRLRIPTGGAEFHLPPHPPCFVTLMEVKPDLAFWWLTECAAPNRTVTSWSVGQMQRDMENGRFRLTHQGIAFDPDGHLRDGQHRCYTCVEAMCTFTTFVFVGLTDEAAQAIDTHRQRTFRDVLQMRGVEHHKLESSIVKKMMTGHQHYKGKFGYEEMNVFREQHLQALNWVCTRFTKHINRITVAPVLSAICRAYYHEDTDRLDAFTEVLKTGKYQQDGDLTAITLRNMLGGGDSKGRRTIDGERLTYLKVENAIAAFCQQRMLSKLYAAQKELYPLPEEG